MSWVWNTLYVFAAYVVVDALTGIYHVLTDRGWNFKQQRDMFAEHHLTNTMQGFDWQPMAASLPFMIYGMFALDAFYLSAGCFGVLTQVAHYWAHHPNYRLVRIAQQLGMIVSPEHHAAHHHGEFDKNFCIFSGWNDCWLNIIARLIPFRNE